MKFQWGKISLRGVLEVLSVLLILFCAIFALIPVNKKPVKNLPLAEGFRYTGMTNNKYPDGKGRVDSILGSSYSGAFKDGFFYGEGLFQSKDGWTYQGTFKKGLPLGGGTIRTPQGLVWKSKDGSAWEKSQTGESLNPKNSQAGKI